MLLPLFLFGMVYSDCLEENGSVSKAMFGLGGVKNLFDSACGKKEIRLLKKDEMDYSKSFHFQFVTPNGDEVSYAKHQETDSSVSMYSILVKPFKGKAKSYVFAMTKSAQSFELLFPLRKGIKSENLTSPTYQLARQKLLEFSENMENLVEAVNDLQSAKAQNPQSSMQKVNAEVLACHEAVFMGLNDLEGIVYPVQTKEILKNKKIYQTNQKD